MQAIQATAAGGAAGLVLGLLADMRRVTKLPFGVETELLHMSPRFTAVLRRVFRRQHRQYMCFPTKRFRNAVGALDELCVDIMAGTQVVREGRIIAVRDALLELTENDSDKAELMELFVDVLNKRK